MIKILDVHDYDVLITIAKVRSIVFISRSHGLTQALELVLKDPL